MKQLKYTLGIMTGLIILAACATGSPNADPKNTAPKSTAEKARDKIVVEAPVPVKKTPPPVKAPE